MSNFTEKKILPFSCEQLFDLVADVESYPDFLPWIISAQISPSQNHEDHFSFLADLTVGYKFMKYPYKCRVHLWPPQQISIEYLEGPFQHLSNEWSFRKVTEKLTELSFFMEFQLKTIPLQSLLTPLLNDVTQHMTSAFEKRASTLY